ncbi:uncharacterized protein M6B38_409085 [Iris pallida]|uniref:Uncharacterized protein n=1 Tax=Iris pallida TaxID=29817 RepID=A0AAX6FPA3_IRIPA|nr:uncharacterized protein M6B38_409085 [Iris pallida]
MLIKPELQIRIAKHVHLFQASVLNICKIFYSKRRMTNRLLYPKSLPLIILQKWCIFLLMLYHQQVFFNCAKHISSHALVFVLYGH